ncbi:hypothetical protein GY45DRAFT_1217545, partial [Cubamyces sp. BRFM 1775]
WYERAMPATAASALSRIGQRMSFSPAMSTTLYMTATSASFTKGLTSPEALVLTSSFGNPSGIAANTSAASEDPPEPPNAT